MPEMPIKSVFIGVTMQSGGFSVASLKDTLMIINHGVEGSSPSALTNEIKVLWDNSGLHPDLIF